MYTPWYSNEYLLCFCVFFHTSLVQAIKTYIDLTNQKAGILTAEIYDTGECYHRDVVIEELQCLHLINCVSDSDFKFISYQCV